MLLHIYYSSHILKEGLYHYVSAVVVLFDVSLSYGKINMSCTWYNQGFGFTNKLTKLKTPKFAQWRIRARCYQFVK